MTFSSFAPCSCNFDRRRAPSPTIVFIRIPFSAHMQDLQEVTHESHYENYRSEKLQPRKQQRTNEIDTDEQQKKLIKEKDDEVNPSSQPAPVMMNARCSFHSSVECKICSPKCKGSSQRSNNWSRPDTNALHVYISLSVLIISICNVQISFFLSPACSSDIFIADEQKAKPELRKSNKNLSKEIISLLQKHSISFSVMSSDHRFFPVDILVLSTLTIVCCISTSAVLYWTSDIARSIALDELGFMLMSDRVKYLLHQRTRRPMQIDRQQPIQRGLLFFSRPDFSTELTRSDVLRSQSIG